MSTTVGKNLLRSSPQNQQRSPKYKACNLKNDRMISVYLQGKLLNIIVNQVYAPTADAEEAEVNQFYEDLQDFLELTPNKDVPFIIRDWNAKKDKRYLE